MRKSSLLMEIERKGGRERQKENKYNKKKENYSRTQAEIVKGTKQITVLLRK